MGLIGGEAVIDDDGIGGASEPVLDIVVPENAIHFGDIQCSVPVGDAVRHIQSVRDGHDAVGLFVCIAVDHRVNISPVAGADKEYSARAQRHRSRPRNVLREERDLKAGGTLES